MRVEANGQHVAAPFEPVGDPRGTFGQFSSSTAPNHKHLVVGQLAILVGSWGDTHGLQMVLPGSIANVNGLAPGQGFPRRDVIDHISGQCFGRDGQARILGLLDELRRERNMALVLISHDLGVVAQVADRVAVMYAGRIVEEGPSASLFSTPAHPYTVGLLRSTPDPDRPRERLAAIPGSVPSPNAWPPGCRFHPRCPDALDRCRQDDPSLVRAPATRAACWLLEEAP